LNELTYLITFACYGYHLHGDDSGSVDRKHNLPRRRLVAADLKRVSAERGQMDQPPYSMDRKRREAVLAALLDSCSYRNWNVLAAHVRASHAHIVVESESQPERIMNDLKSYASRHLNRMGLDQAARKRWARHGSTRWLWKAEHVSAAVRYVVDEQGERMSVFEAGLS
jgi:REP element-mobilizing transposase RayT